VINPSLTLFFIISQALNPCCVSLQEGVECDGCWSESFLQFTDSKPHGPEALSLDITFPGFEHVYGLPEHAMSFALKPTGTLLLDLFICR
jgi:hypothetical protein